MDDYLSKPIKKENLMMTINKWASQSRGTQRQKDDHSA